MARGAADMFRVVVQFAQHDAAFQGSDDARGGGLRVDAGAHVAQLQPLVERARDKAAPFVREKTGAVTQRWVGVVGFAFSTKINEKYSTKLMATRVVLQGVAVLLFALMALLQNA